MERGFKFGRGTRKGKGARAVVSNENEKKLLKTSSTGARAKRDRKKKLVTPTTSCQGIKS